MRNEKMRFRSVLALTVLISLAVFANAECDSNFKYRQLLKDALNKFEKDGYKLNFKYNRLGKQNEIHVVEMYHRDVRSYINQNYVWPITRSLLNIRRVVQAEAIFDVINHCHQRKRTANLEQQIQTELQKLHESIESIEIKNSEPYFVNGFKCVQIDLKTDNEFTFYLTDNPKATFPIQMLEIAFSEREEKKIFYDIKFDFTNDFSDTWFNTPRECKYNVLSVLAAPFASNYWSSAELLMS